MADELEKLTFKKMTFKQKVEHIWEYYRINIFLTIVFLIISGSLINTIFINPAPKTYAGVAFYDDYINSEIIQSLTDSFTNEFVPKEENLQVKFSCYYESESDPTIAVDMARKFEMLLYAHELDIIVTGKNTKTDIDYFTGFANQGLLAPLDVIFSKQELDEFEQKGVLVYCADSEGKSRPFGLNMKNTSSVLKDYEGFTQNGRIAGISNVTERPDNAKQIIKALVR